MRLNGISFANKTVMNTKYLSGIIKLLTSLTICLFLTFFGAYASADDVLLEDYTSLPNQRLTVLGAVLVQSKGWCFAYAAADLISYRLNQRVSVQDVALSYYAGRLETKSTNPFEGGNIEAAINAASKKGLCLEKDFPTDGANEIINSGLLAFNRNQAINWLTFIQKLRISVNGKSDPEKPGFYEMYPHLSLNDMLTILNTRDFKNGEIALAFRDANCKDRTLSPVSLKVKTKEGRMLDWYIDNQLNRGNLVAIYYFADFLLKNPDKSGTETVGHASTVVAKRVKGTTTQYLIRQSWAYDTKYAAGVEKEPSMPGYIWVNASALIPNVYGVTYIEN
jgi:hypothetical protein